jgi:hypothetical protein
MTNQFLGTAFLTGNYKFKKKDLLSALYFVRDRFWVGAGATSIFYPIAAEK